MTDAALTIPFSAGAGDTQTTERRFVHLEQIDPPESSNTVTMFDISQMVARARMGISARTFKPFNCPAYINNQSIISQFDFYSWPSAVDLPHTIISSLGEVSVPKIVEKTIHFSRPFELSDVVELDFIMTSITSATWETACYDADGKVVEVCTPYMDGLSTIRIDKPVFGVVRIVGIKKGAKHSLNVRLVKMVPAQHNGDLPTEEEFEESGAAAHYTYQEWLSKFYGFTDAVSWQGQQGNDKALGKEPVNLTGLSISNLQATVTSKWIGVDGEEKTEQLRMKIPQCIQDLLSACGTDTDGDGIPDYWGTLPERSFRLCGPGDHNPYQVYISQCTCNILAVIERDNDENSWCKS